MIGLCRDVGKNVTRRTDSRLFDHIFGKFGLFTPCMCTRSGLDKITVSSCVGIICGNDFEIELEELTVPLPESGTIHGRILIRLDLSAEEKISFAIQTAVDAFPELEQNEMANEVNGVYEDILCTYDASAAMITEVRMVADTVKLAGNGKEIVGTLPVGQTELTLTDPAITDDCTFENIYTTISGVPWPDIVADVENHGVTLTFDEQEEDMGVKVRIL